MNKIEKPIKQFMKRKHIIWLLIMIFTVFLIYIYIRASHHSTLIKTYKSIVLTTISTPIKEYYNDHGNYPENQKQLLRNMIEKFPHRDYELIKMMNHLNLNFKIHKDTLIVYDKGFDNIDNKLKKKFIINNNINLFKTFFIKGDIEICYISLTNNENGSDSNKKKKKRPIPPRINNVIN